MFILDFSIGSVFGARIIAPKWNVSLNPSESLFPKRNLAQEHLTYAAMLGIPLGGVGIYKSVIGFFSGDEGLKEKISGVFTLLCGAVFVIIGHVNKTSDKKEVDQFIEKFRKPSKETEETLGDLVLGDTKEMYASIKAMPKSGVILNLFGQTNLGKSTLLRVLPKAVAERLKTQLGHDVKVNAVTVDNKFLDFDGNGKSPSEMVKIFLKYYQKLLEDANKGCTKGDVKEVYVLQIEESSGLLTERLKAHLEDFVEYCPGLCVAFTSNEEKIPDAFNKKRGCFNVPFRKYNQEQNLDIFKLKLKCSLGENYSDELYDKMKPLISKLFNDSGNFGEPSQNTRNLSEYLAKINPFNIKNISNELGENINKYYPNKQYDKDSFQSALIEAFTNAVLEHTSLDARGTVIEPRAVQAFIQHCLNRQV